MQVADNDCSSGAGLRGLCAIEQIPSRTPLIEENDHQDRAGLRGYVERSKYRRRKVEKTPV